MFLIGAVELGTSRFDLTSLAQPDQNSTATNSTNEEMIKLTLPNNSNISSQSLSSSHQTNNPLSFTSSSLVNLTQIERGDEEEEEGGGGEDHLFDTFQSEFDENNLMLPLTPLKKNPIESGNMRNESPSPIKLNQPKKQKKSSTTTTKRKRTSHLQKSNSNQHDDEEEEEIEDLPNQIKKKQKKSSTGGRRKQKRSKKKKSKEDEDAHHTFRLSLTSSTTTSTSSQQTTTSSNNNFMDSLMGEPKGRWGLTCCSSGSSIILFGGERDEINKEEEEEKEGQTPNSLSTISSHIYTLSFPSTTSSQEDEDSIPPISWSSPLPTLSSNEELDEGNGKGDGISSGFSSSSVSKGRVFHTSTFIPTSNLLIVFGGESLRRKSGDRGNVGELMVYDIGIDLWYPPTISGKEPTPRSGHSGFCVFILVIFISIKIQFFFHENILS